MSFCVLAKENPFGDIVALEGEFVRTFLKDMPPEFVKLYVFCQYALTNDVRCGSISELASACAVTVESVEAALEYFSSEQLLSVASRSPLAIEVRSVREAAEKKNSELPGVLSGYGDYFAALRALVGREMKPSEMEKAKEWVEVYQLPEPVIMLLVQHCMDGIRKSSKKTRSIFAYIDAAARAWAENGITTLSEAEHYLSVYELEHHVVNDVMLHIGIRRMPSVEEVRLYEKWTGEWGFSHEDIINACAETTKTANPSFAYLDKIIEGMRDGAAKTGQTEEFLRKTRTKREEAAELLRTMGLGGNVTQELLDIIKAAKLSGFDAEALQFVAKTLGKRAYKSVESFERELALWQERGITTAKAMEEYNTARKGDDEKIKALYAAMGVDAAVSAEDRRIYSFLCAKGFTQEKMLAIANECSGMKELRRKLTGGAKRTSAHDYDERTSEQNDIYTALDELEDN